MQILPCRLVVQGKRKMKQALAIFASGEAEGPRAAQMRYYLGLSYYKKADYDSAARHLELSLAGRVDQAGVNDVRFYLATCLEKIGQLPEHRTPVKGVLHASPVARGVRSRPGGRGDGSDCHISSKRPECEAPAPRRRRRCPTALDSGRNGPVG